MSNNHGMHEILISNLRNGYYQMNETEHAAMNNYCEQYKTFLNNSRTERTCVSNGIALAQAAGFEQYQTGMRLEVGQKIYINNRGKFLIFAKIGKRPLSEGVNIVASHIDSPRLDLKPYPLYEEAEMAYLKTHYYGMVRKYQWVATPLMLQGVVVLKDGTVIDVTLGGDNEPKFVITDLLPHLSREHDRLPLSEAHPAESMNILIGSRPVNVGDNNCRVKLHIMSLLNQKYGITEEDLTSAEIEAVPAYPVTDVGIDASLIGGYGHDDKVCGYAALKGLIDCDSTDKTSICIFADKEEVLNNGVTGMRGAAFDHFMQELCESQGSSLRECYKNSFCLSADVTSAYDPNFADAFDIRNSAHINRGIAICKYTGVKGKESASDACAELIAYLRRIFDQNKVIWQMGEMGRTDLGGGGTVSLEIANRNIDTIDAGVPVLSMHAPFEIVSKLDCYMTYKACMAVYNS
jgi:aspartyl aminopeptidase